MGQFGSFDGKDNRKEVLRLFQKMGHGVSEEVAAARRAQFLSALLRGSAMPGMATKPCLVTPCSPTDAYFEFVALTGCLGVNIEEAAKQLEEAVR